MHILLVEDDPFIAKAVCAALESEAHAVTWTPTGREGLAVIATGTPDAVLLDLGLPGMDGIDVLKSIRAMTKPLCDTPVIIVTAREALESRLEGLDAGADALEDVDAVHAGESQIEEHGVGRAGCDDGEPLAARRGPRDGVRLAFERRADGLGNERIVFDKKDVHDGGRTREAPLSAFRKRKTGGLSPEEGPPA
jgi:CheY-like chemotaxis protein